MVWSYPALIAKRSISVTEIPTEAFEANAEIQLVLTGTKNDTHIEGAGTYEELKSIKYQETLSVSPSAERKLI